MSCPWPRHVRAITMPSPYPCRALPCPCPCHVMSVSVPVPCLFMPVSSDFALCPCRVRAVATPSVSWRRRVCTTLGRAGLAGRRWIDLNWRSRRPAVGATAAERRQSRALGPDWRRAGAAVMCACMTRIPNRDLVSSEGDRKSVLSASPAPVSGLCELWKVWQDLWSSAEGYACEITRCLGAQGSPYCKRSVQTCFVHNSWS